MGSDDTTTTDTTTDGPTGPAGRAAVHRRLADGPGDGSDGNGALRIALSGGPGGGKTTAADLFRREIGDSVIIVPESATMLFAGGFPRVHESTAQRSVQKAIFEVQRSLEDIQRNLYPDRVLLCDRGTVDGAAYWPEGAEDFFEAMGSTHEAELARYDTVLFFETASVGGIVVEGGNRFRTESEEQAVALDAHLRQLWSAHPSFHLVPHNTSFLHKITMGLSILESVVSTRRDRRSR